MRVQDPRSRWGKVFALQRVGINEGMSVASWGISVLDDVYVSRGSGGVKSLFCRVSKDTKAASFDT
jgi:hypothetical protein